MLFSRFNLNETINFATMDWLPKGLECDALYSQFHHPMVCSVSKVVMDIVQQERELPSGGHSVLRLMLTALESLTDNEEEGRRALHKLPEIVWTEDPAVPKTTQCTICSRTLHISSVVYATSATKALCLHHAKQLQTSHGDKMTLRCRYPIRALKGFIRAVDAAYHKAEEVRPKSPEHTGAVFKTQKIPETKRSAPKRNRDGPRGPCNRQNHKPTCQCHLHVNYSGDRDAKNARQVQRGDRYEKAKRLREEAHRTSNVQQRELESKRPKRFFSSSPSRQHMQRSTEADYASAPEDEMPEQEKQDSSACASSASKTSQPRDTTHHRRAKSHGGWHHISLRKEQFGADKERAAILQNQSQMRANSTNVTEQEEDGSEEEEAIDNQDDDLVETVMAVGIDQVNPTSPFPCAGGCGMFASDPRNEGYCSQCFQRMTGPIESGRCLQGCGFWGSSEFRGFCSVCFKKRQDAAVQILELKGVHGAVPAQFYQKVKPQSAS